MRRFTGSGRAAASLAGALLIAATIVGAPVAAQEEGGVDRGLHVLDRRR